MRRPKKPKFKIGDLVRLVSFVNQEKGVVVYPLKNNIVLDGRVLSSSKNQFLSPLYSIIDLEYTKGSAGISKSSDTVALVLGLPFVVDYSDHYTPYNWFPILVDSKVCIAIEGIINKVLAVEP